MMDEKEETVSKLLQLNIHAKRIEDAIKVYSGKEVTKWKTMVEMKKNALLDTMQCILDSNEIVKLIIDIENELKVLYFQIQNLSKFPEVLFLAGTFLTNNKNMTLFSILVKNGKHDIVKNGNSEGKVAANGFLANESKEKVTTFLKLFKDNKPCLTETKVVIVVSIYVSLQKFIFNEKIVTGSVLVSMP